MDAGFCAEDSSELWMRFKHTSVRNASNTRDATPRAELFATIDLHQFRTTEVGQKEDQLDPSNAFDWRLDPEQ